MPEKDTASPVDLTAWERLRQRTLTVEQSRAVDRLAIEVYGMQSLVLMENAALGCVEWLLHRCPAPQATSILCGRGNNGGDGLAIARHLTNRGWPCQVILLGPASKLANDAQANLNILTAGTGGVPVEILQGPLPVPARKRLSHSTVIIDALLGTGAGGAPRAPLDDWLRAANQGQALRVAIDVPTGVDAELGDAELGDAELGDAELEVAVLEAPAHAYFQAAATLTFVAKKPAMLRAAAERLFGEVHVLPIGIPTQMMHEIVTHW